MSSELRADACVVSPDFVLKWSKFDLLEFLQRLVHLLGFLDELRICGRKACPKMPHELAQRRVERGKILLDGFRTLIGDGVVVTGLHEDTAGREVN